MFAIFVVTQGKGGFNPEGSLAITIIGGAFLYFLAYKNGKMIEEDELKDAERQRESGRKAIQTNHTPRDDYKLSIEDLRETFKPELYEKSCPDCYEDIKLPAKVCRFCGAKFSSDEVERKIEEKFQEIHPN